MSVGRDVAEGRLSPAALEAAAVEECRQLVGQVIGPDDALWGLQLEVCRGVLAAGGVPANELAEWLAVAQAAEGVEFASGGIIETPPDADLVLADGGCPTITAAQAKELGTAALLAELNNPARPCPGCGRPAEDADPACLQCRVRALTYPSEPVSEL